MMPRRKLIGLSLLLGFTSMMHGNPTSEKSDFQQALGIQLWSLREQAKLNPVAALDLARDYHFALVETAGTGSMTTVAYAEALKQRGLKAVAAHMPYERLKADLAAVISEAKTLGATYVVIPWLPNEEGIFDAEAIAKEFDTWGAQLRAAGLKFGYHPHGYEFRPMEGGGTRFDILIAKTKPENVCLEMDVFWVAHAGIDPVALLKKFPDRWRLLHVKDMRRGVVTGIHTGRAPATDKVAVGQGQFDWPAILRAAEKAGVEYYFLEDEGIAPLEHIPASLVYLRDLKL